MITKMPIKMNHKEHSDDEPNKQILNINWDKQQKFKEEKFENDRNWVMMSITMTRIVSHTGPTLLG